MAEFDVEGAKQYLASIKLVDDPTLRNLDFDARVLVAKTFTMAANVDAAFDEQKNQAQVIGSGLFSFEAGVDSGIREAISDSALLAQLYANKKSDFVKHPKEWFGVYSELLQNVGWTLQERNWTDQEIDGTQVEVNEQIVAVLTIALGGAPTALGIIAASIKAMHDADPASPWVTLFNRDVQHAGFTRFTVGFVGKDANDGVFVTMAACILDKVTKATQVLFFKWKQAHATLEADVQKCSINQNSLKALGPDIRAKIRVFQTTYLSGIVDL